MIRSPIATGFRERPIMFSGPMVRAILEGRKTQTRRVIPGRGAQEEPDKYRPSDFPACRYGYLGDRLWVRETWQDCCPLWAGAWCGCGSTEMKAATHWVAYQATPYVEPGPLKWRTPIFMPRWASRLTLEVTGVRVERLQDISVEDAIAEGIDPKPHLCDCETCARTSKLCPATVSSIVMEYAAYWDTLHAKGDGITFESNPWIWAVDFRRVTQTSDENTTGSLAPR